MRIARLLLSATLGLLFLPAHAYAQGKSYADEYQNRIKSASNVQGHGETPFGESIDLYTGQTTFSSTGITGTYVAKHPTGLTGTFRFSGRLRAQSYMSTICVADPWSGTYSESNNPYFFVAALVERELSGPGMANTLWTNTYEAPHVSALRDCPGTSCQSTTYTDVTESRGDRTRYIHSTRNGAIQGTLVRAEVYNASSVLQQAENKTYNYAEDDMQYPSTFGNSLYFANPPYATENLVLLRKSLITQQGRNFTWEVPSGYLGGLSGYCFDAYGKPTKIIKSSSP